MQKVRGAILCGLITLTTFGCGISKDQYMKLESEKKEFEQNVDELSRQVDRLAREKEELSYFNQSLQNENRRLLQERDTLRQQIGPATKPEGEEEPLK